MNQFQNESIRKYPSQEESKMSQFQNESMTKITNPKMYQLQKELTPMNQSQGSGPR